MRGTIEEGEVLLRRAMLLWKEVDQRMRLTLGAEREAVWVALARLEWTVETF